MKSRRKRKSSLFPSIRVGLARISGQDGDQEAWDGGRLVYSSCGQSEQGLFDLGPDWLSGPQVRQYRTQPQNVFGDLYLANLFIQATVDAEDDEKQSESRGARLRRLTGGRNYCKDDY